MPTDYQLARRVHPDTLTVHLPDYVEGSPARLVVKFRQQETITKIGPLEPLGNDWFDTGVQINSPDDLISFRLETERA